MFISCSTERLYYSHINDEMHMGRNVRGRRIVCFSHVALGDYIIHTFNDKMHMGRNVCKAPSANMNFISAVERLFIYLIVIIHMLKMR